ncbi:PAS domain S-box protein [Paenibacillus sp.]|uniref:PAS domain S-box protein n=1 Tax=Paenibacillus sp. TaxID=58172 RepID=UPI002D686BA4|nr:PAS domain S-box protein [Paenibacillus sp.]HZG56965.1 PAS domain S-box protein [Paenibacillus sp.]
MTQFLPSAPPLFSEEQYRYILEQMPEPIVVYREFRIVYANAAALRVVCAVSPEQVVGRSIFEFLPPKYHDAASTEAELISRRGAPAEPVMKQWLRLDGQLADVLVRAFPIDYGGVPSVLLVCKDMTTEKDFQRSLYRSEQLLLKIIQFSPQAIVLHTDDIVHFINDATMRMFHAKDPAELIGRKIYDFIHPDYHEVGKWRLARARESGARLDFVVHKMIRLDGEVFDAEAASVVVGDVDGCLTVQTVLRDVTERLAYEESLRSNSERFERLIKFLPEPIVITDQGMIVYCNKLTAKLVRLEHVSDVIGRSILEFIHPDDHAASMEVVREVLQTDDPTPFRERRLVCGDGTVITVEISSIQIYNYNGKSVTLSVLRDVTERKEADELLLRSEKLSVIGQLAAGVAHEIRNPLTSLRGFTQLLRKELDPKKFYYVDTMLSELDRINYIVNDFMSLSKPHIVAYRDHDIAELLHAVLVILESETTLYNIAVHLTETGARPRVRCDEHRIKQVFLNVLKNAIEAMPHGGSIHIAIAATDGRCLSIRIRDEGTGMPEEIVRKLGEPFFTTKSDGTGLGLMICQRILEAHGGALRIASVPDAGTTVTIELPITPDQPV